MERKLQINAELLWLATFGAAWVRYQGSQMSAQATLMVCVVCADSAVEALTADADGGAG